HMIPFNSTPLPLMRFISSAAACAALLSGCTTGPHPGPGTVAAELTTQADRWDKAIVHKDRASIEANMADDFRQIDGAGNIETKASFVDDLVSADLQIDPYAVEELDVRVYGDVALLSGRTRMTGRYQGKAFASHYRYIDVYVRRNGVWKIVSVQISRIPSAPPAP
ncbi:MAG: nuclear transport factor 2 family protein, partial [Burkholderiales bacterium]